MRTQTAPKFLPPASIWAARRKLPSYVVFDVPWVRAAQKKIAPRKISGTST